MNGNGQPALLYLVPCTLGNGFMKSATVRLVSLIYIILCAIGLYISFLRKPQLFHIFSLCALVIH